MIVETSAIVARDMGVRRGGRRLLRPASFGVAEGVTGLAGPPRVGKTSLLATFATMRRPHTGGLEILGYDAEDGGNLRAIRAQLGYLPKDIRWASSLNVGEFVGYAAYYKRVGRTAVDFALARMELDDVGGVEIGRLPPDVRLRAGLAATCVHEPDLVLLDEPLTGIDETARAELMPLVRALAPTVLLTASAAQELTGWCDRVLSLARGRLTELPTRTGNVTKNGRASVPPTRRPSRRDLERYPEHRFDRVLAGTGARG
jgi:ABC-2 type transport system ATP-binding protein